VLTGSPAAPPMAATEPVDDDAEAVDATAAVAVPLNSGPTAMPAPTAPPAASNPRRDMWDLKSCSSLAMPVTLPARPVAHPTAR